MVDEDHLREKNFVTEQIKVINEDPPSWPTPKWLYKPRANWEQREIKGRAQGKTSKTTF